MATYIFVDYPSCFYLEQVTESSTNYIERICQEHHAIVNMPITGPCKKFKKLKKNQKNLCFNINCWDTTRVWITGQRGYYIHANYVDGFDYVRKFIVTHEPLDSTLENFWIMIWQTGTRVIVMLNGADETTAPPVSYCSELKGFTVTVDSIVLHTDYVEMIMTVFNIHTCQSRTVHYFKYLSWPKGGITDIPTLMMFLREVNEKQHHFHKEDLMPLPSPIVLYSSTGTGRAATFCAIDICVFQLINASTISVPSVVHKIRQQRHSSIGCLDDYVFINNFIVYFLSSIPRCTELSLELFSRCSQNCALIIKSTA